MGEKLLTHTRQTNDDEVAMVRIVPRCGVLSATPCPATDILVCENKNSRGVTASSELTADHGISLSCLDTQAHYHETHGK